MELNNKMLTAEGLLLTGIGSLPHHNVDAALSYSFQHDIPYLPQLPKKNPKEFMIYQALENFPGTLTQQDGSWWVDKNPWCERQHDYGAKLDEALNTQEFAEFLPTSEVMAAWNPFLFELEEQQVKTAKIQIIGPLTLLLGLKLQNGEDLKNFPILQSQLLKTLTVKALGMVDELLIRGVRPLLFIDEPGLYAWNEDSPLFASLLTDLQIFILIMQKKGALVGLHCCSNTNWKKILTTLPVDYLSVDVNLSLQLILAQEKELRQFLLRGGNFSLGVIPTNLTSSLESSLKISTLQHWFTEFFKDTWKQSLSGMLLTPACGLAFQSTAHVLFLFSELRKWQRQLLDFGLSL